MLYFADRLVEAEHYYEYLRTHYGLREYGGKVETRFTLPLRDFVLKTFYSDITGIRETNSAIQMLLVPGLCRADQRRDQALQPLYLQGSRCLGSLYEGKGTVPNRPAEIAALP